MPLFVSLIFLEILILHLQGRKKRLPRSNDAFSSISAGLLSLTPVLLMRDAEITAYIWVYENYCIYALPWNSPWTWLLSMVGVDFCYYWVHRCSHEINLMWAGHQAHHSSEDYNYTTALRQSVFLKYTTWIFYLPMAFFIPASLFVVHIQFNMLYQFWVHTETVGKIGPLEYVLNTPSHHRVHHGVNRYCIDKNFAGVFIVWDRLFGTYEEEQKLEHIVYGVTRQLRSWNPVYAQVCQWIHILKTARRVEGLSNKLSVFVKGPGWEPGKPRLGYIEDIPDVRAPVEKYDKSVSTPLSVYCWLQFLLILILYMSIAPMLNELPVTVLWLAFVYMLFALLNIGFIFESRWFALHLHLVQLVLYLSMDAYLCNGAYSNCTLGCPPLLYYLKIGVVASIAIVIPLVLSRPLLKK